MKPALVAEAPSPTLVSLASESFRIAQMITEAGGELTPEIEAMLDVNAESLAQKVDSYVWVEGQAEAQAEFFDKQAKQYAAIAKGFKRTQERLRERIKYVMAQMNITEIKGKQNRYTLRASKPKLVIDEKLVPAELKMQVVTMVPDKERIRTSLEEGFEVEGAHLEPVHVLNDYKVKE